MNNILQFLDWYVHANKLRYCSQLFAVGSRERNSRRQRGPGALVAPGAGHDGRRQNVESQKWMG